jgi:hypothetical protein
MTVKTRPGGPRGRPQHSDHVAREGRPTLKNPIQNDYGLGNALRTLWALREQTQLRRVRRCASECRTFRPSRYPS